MPSAVNYEMTWEERLSEALRIARAINRRARAEACENPSERSILFENSSSPKGHRNAHQNLQERKAS